MQYVCSRPAGRLRSLKSLCWAQMNPEIKEWNVEALLEGDSTTIMPEQGAAILAGLAQRNFEDAQLIPGRGRLGVTCLMAGASEPSVKQAATEALNAVLPDFEIVSVTAVERPT